MDSQNFRESTKQLSNQTSYRQVVDNKRCNFSEVVPQKQESPELLSKLRAHNTGNDLLSHRIVAVLPSAAEGLTSVFGMGTCVSPRL